MKNRRIMIGSRFLVIFWILTLSLTVNSRPTATVKDKSTEQDGMSSNQKAFLMYFQYASKINSLAEYPKSERHLALDKLMEIHDELLGQYLNADSEIETALIEVLLAKLKRSVKKSPLIRYNSMLITKY